MKIILDKNMKQNLSDVGVMGTFREIIQRFKQALGFGFFKKAEVLSDDHERARRLVNEAKMITSARQVDEGFTPIKGLNLTKKS
jgi:hypothetical protein